MPQNFDPRRLAPAGLLRRGGRGPVSSSIDPFSVAAAAAALPTVSFGHTWLQAPGGNGITLADGDTTVQQWAATYGGNPLAVVLAAPLSTNRPAWNASGGAGGRPMVVFDGATDGLVDAAVTRGGTWGSFEIGYGGGVHTTGTGVDQLIGYGATASVRFSITSSATASRCDMTTTGTGGVTSIMLTAESATMRHWSMDWDGSTQHGRLAGAIEDTDAATPSAYADGSPFWIGARSDQAANTGCNIQFWYISTRILTAGERTYLRALATYLSTIAS